MANHSAHVFERLRELNSKMFLPVRDFSAYEKLLYINEFSLGNYGKISSRNECPYWLEIKRPEFEELPKIPVEVIDWIVDWGGQILEFPPKVKLYYDNSEEFWFDNITSANSPNLSDLYGERFDNDKKRVKIWEQWLTAAWLPWANANAEKLRAMETYESFWNMVQDIERNPGRYEIVWSTAVLLWRTEGMDIRHPLLSQRMEIEYNAEQGVFKLLATNKGPRLEYEMLVGILGIDIDKLFDLEQELVEEPFDLREYDSLEKFCSSLTQAVGHNCKISIEDSLKNQQISRQPYIYYGEPVVMLRKLDCRKWRGELETAVDEIASGSNVIDVFRQYYKKDEIVESYIDDGEDDYYEEKEEQILFPWSVEKRQEKILKNILNNPLTVVQTLPYSNKTELIANLLVNFLAKGMRVLVTSDSNLSLQKVSRLLNDEYSEIMALCVDATGAERTNAKALISSLKAYNEQINVTTRSEVMRERDFLQKKLDGCKENILVEKEALVKARKLENTSYFIIEGVKKAPWQVAKWIKENKEDLGYIPDDIGSDTACPLNKSEMSRMFELAGQLSLEERQQLALWRPPLLELIKAKELIKLFDEIDYLAIGEAQRQELLEDCQINQEVDTVTARMMLADYQQALAEFPITEEKWLTAILKDNIKAVKNNKDTWEDFYYFSDNRLQKIMQLNETVKEHEIILPSDLPSSQLKKALEFLRAEFYKNNKISLLFRMTTGKEAVGILQNCFLDGLIPNSAQAIDLLIAKVDLLNELNIFINKWDSVLQKVHGPVFLEAAIEYLPLMDDALQKIGKVIEWQEKYLDTLKSHEQIFTIKNQNPNFIEREWYMKMLPRLQAWCQEKNFENLQEQLQQQKDLVNCTDKPDEYYLDPICYMMEEALYNKDIEEWELCYLRLENLNEQQKIWNEFQALYNRLAKVAPLWTEELLSKGKDILHNSPKEWTAAWRLNQACSWLDKHIEESKLEELTEQFEEQTKKEKEFIKDVAASSAWEWQLRRVSKEEAMALDNFWQQVDLPGGQKEFSLPSSFWRQAEFWRSSLPCWLISTNSLLENAGSFDKLFDVVIIDESEQSSIFASSLLLRAKKAVVIGDDMLPSDKEFVNAKKADSALLEKILVGCEEKDKFQLQDSLYDIALRLAENKKELLNECGVSTVNLAGFVNRSFYNEQMALLPKAFNFGEVQPELVTIPVKIRQMTGQYNRDEAEFMLCELDKMLEQPEYQEKTVAIMTLGGDEQQNILQEWLLEHLSEETVAKHQIICTSMENYSGFTRDIVFMSLVSAKVAETTEGKYINAALYATGEQLRLFHPFVTKDISSRCLVAQLLRLSELPEKEGKFAKNQLVQEVLAEILAKGYQAKLAGDYSDCFDIIVEKNGSKVAVVCDGLRNQVELDIAFAQEESFIRQGWQFYHLRGCKFYLNGEASLENLWHILSRLDIL